MKKEVPKSLRNWFVFHFIIDYLFGIPLLLFPSWTFLLFNLNPELFSGRLLGAGLIGTGGVSLIAYHKSKEIYQTLLNFKLIWSLAAIIGISISIFQEPIKSKYFLLGIFIFFFLLWLYYKKRIQSF